jgi:TonB family protein
MIKTVFLFLLGLMLTQTAKAQKPDSVVFYMKDRSTQVATKDSASYILIIMQADGSKLFPVKEYYRNGKLKLTGKALSQKPYVELEGNSTSYYRNGNRKSTSNYHNGLAIGLITTYYPNGNFYSSTDYTSDYKTKLIECHDSTGKVLATNGTGHWIRFDERFKLVTGEGEIVDSLQNGQWHGSIDSISTYTCTYVKGEGMAGVRYAGGQSYPFAKAEVEPEFKGGKEQFYSFLSQKVKYPKKAKEDGIQGKVFVTFVVEKDGTLSHIKAIPGPDESLVTEAVRVVSISPPWQPGSQYGLPVRVQYTIPLAFSLGLK